VSDSTSGEVINIRNTPSSAICKSSAHVYLQEREEEAAISPG